MNLPHIFRKGDLIWFEFIEQDTGRIAGMFKIVEVLHVMQAGKGYEARLIVKPHSDQTSPDEKG